MPSLPDSSSPAPADQNVLFAALARGDLEALKAALEAGADPNACRRDCATADFGYTPLTYPYVSQNPRAVSMLLKAGADPNQPDMLGALPLMAALKRQQTSDFAVLIAAGADPTKIVDREGGSILHAAARSRTPDYIFFARHFNMNARDKRGRTPLMTAVENNALRVVEEIERSGGDIAAPNHRGETPLAVAQKNKHGAIADFLSAALARRERQALLDRVQELEEEMRDLKKLLQVSNARRPGKDKPRP